MRLMVGLFSGSLGSGVLHRQPTMTWPISCQAICRGAGFRRVRLPASMQLLKFDVDLLTALQATRGLKRITMLLIIMRNR